MMIVGLKKINFNLFESVKSNPIATGYLELYKFKHIVYQRKFMNFYIDYIKKNN